MLYNQQVWLEEYTNGEGLYYKGEHSDSSDCFSDVESSNSESDSDSDYFEEAFKNNKEIKIDYCNTLDVKKPNSHDKNIISTESLTTLITKCTVCKKCHGQINIIEDYSNSIGLARTFKTECNCKECTKNSVRLTPKNGCFHEINCALVLACDLLGKYHAGGKKLAALLNLDKPISKKAWTKHTCSVAENTKNLGEIYMNKAALEAKMFLKNTGSIKFDPLDDIEKQNMEIAVSVDDSWGSRGWNSQNGIVDVCFEETGKVLDVAIKSTFSHQYLTVTT